MTRLLSSGVTLAHLLNIYTTNVPQIEEHLGYEFQTKPEILLETPTIEIEFEGETRPAYASYGFTDEGAYIKINPETKESRLQYLIAHELGHHHFAELEHWEDWEHAQEWGRFLSEVYSEWVGCSYVDDCTFYRSGGVKEFAFHPGDIPRASFWPQMEELFERKGLEVMMQHPPEDFTAGSVPTNEWYVEIKERL